MVVTARENGLSPMRYVEWLLEELPLAGDLSDPAVAGRYLPWSDGVPDRCRVPGRRTEELRAAQEEPVADVDPGALREDEWRPRGVTALPMMAAPSAAIIVFQIDTRLF